MFPLSSKALILIANFMEFQIESEREFMLWGISTSFKL